MKIIKDEKKIKRNGSIGLWISMVAFLILGGGLWFTTTNPTNPSMPLYAFGSFIVGFILMQVGTYMTNRWGGKPSPDERLDAGLKGLSGDFSLYHFQSPASHLLVGPAGVWTIFLYRQRGIVKYEKNRWKVSSGGFLQGYMSIFGQEGIGRPDLEAEGEVAAIQKQLAKSLGEGEVPSVNAVLVFTNDDLDIQAEGAPLIAVKLKGLKDFIRQKAKETKLSTTAIAKINTALGQ